ncbi:MAG: agmatine deiminase family protein [Bacteroidetes bacterium]|nr:agmatine deiminase family protein [Bacteroidota bacterium]
MFENSPKKLGFIFPAEWEKQKSIWFSWPHNLDTWPGKLDTAPKVFAKIISEICETEFVNINVVDEKMDLEVNNILSKHPTTKNNFATHLIPTNDAWCRDHGPAFIINRTTKEKAIVDWDYNALGGKYPPFDLDDIVPTKIGEKFGLKIFYPGIIMEGGAIDVNGEGCLLTSKSCLLNKNRNPHLTQNEIENYLKEFYGQEKILWLDEGIVGDDTDGHIDDIARFINPTTIVACVEEDTDDENYNILQENLQQLQKMQNQNNENFRILELPMPGVVEYKNQRLPASYANFLITNKKVLVPVFNHKNDLQAIEILQKEFLNRKVVGIDCVDLVWGLGTIHCISQQEAEI